MNSFINKKLLTEGARDNALQMFMPYLQKRGINMSISQLKQALHAKFVGEANIHNLSLGGNYYLLGVARYYFNGELTTNKQINILYPRVRDRFIPEVCERLDALINILRNAYIDSVGTKWEQPEDFGTLNLKQLLRKYGAKINKELGIEPTPKKLPAKAEDETPKVSDDYTAGSNYTYEILYSYEDAKKYNQATTPGAWCITWAQQHYDGYVKRLGIHYVIFRQNGYEKIPRKVGPGFTKLKPHDAYGNSLIAVLQSNKSPEPVYITSRWNHGVRSEGTECEADHAYTTQEFLQTIGCDYSVLERAFSQWKAISEVKNKKDRSLANKDKSKDRADKLSCLRALKYMQMLINGGSNPFIASDLIDGFNITFHPFGWNPREWEENHGIDAMTPENAPQKMPYFVKIRTTNEEGLTYTTVMDRKTILFDKILDPNMTYRSDGTYGDNFIAIEPNHDYFYIYDRIRHNLLDVDGVTKFKYSSEYMTWRDTKVHYKYIVIGLSGTQLALINLKTMKPVKTRRGTSWFETIVPVTRYNRDDETNYDYSGRIRLKSSNDDILKLIYDSASGEVYYYNAFTDKFINVKENIPQGFYIDDRAITPGKRYIAVTDNEEATKIYGAWPTDGINYMFINLDDNSIFKIEGTSLFKDFDKSRHSVVGYMVEGSDNVYYYDLNLKKHLEFNGQLVTTKEKPDFIGSNGAGYVLISFSRYKLGDDGKYHMGNFYHKCMLYNPIIGEFYHDDISGYMFNIYGTGCSSVTVYYPEGHDADGSKYTIPSAEKVAEKMKETESLVRAESMNIIGNIIREEINRLIGFNFLM